MIFVVNQEGLYQLEWLLKVTKRQSFRQCGISSQLCAPSSYFTISCPHFSDCGKMTLPKHSCAYWSNPPFYFLTLGHSGAQDWTPECRNVTKLQELITRWDTRTWRDVSSYMVTYLPLNYDTPVLRNIFEVTRTYLMGVCLQKVPYYPVSVFLEQTILLSVVSRFIREVELT